MANRGRALADRIIAFFGDRQPGVGRGIELNNDEQFAAIGVEDHADLRSALVDLQKEEPLNYAMGVARGEERLAQGNIPTMLLTLAGWDRYERLKKANPQSSIAFMAMQFEDAQMDRIYADHFVPAIREIGYELETVKQQAGLIDYHIRLQVTASRFVLADLTHDNRGVYFEAGYADGIGRPVIYTCRSDAFNPNKGKPHFDVNHQRCVRWDDPPTSAQLEELQVTIRHTLLRG